MPETKRLTTSKGWEHIREHRRSYVIGSEILCYFVLLSVFGLKPFKHLGTGTVDWGINSADPAFLATRHPFNRGINCFL